jgi:hypothetical protein
MPTRRIFLRSKLVYILGKPADDIIDELCYVIVEMMLSGCWGENKADVKIAVERCGCNSASSSFHYSRLIMWAGFLVAAAALYF